MAVKHMEKEVSWKLKIDTAEMISEEPALSAPAAPTSR